MSEGKAADDLRVFDDLLKPGGASREPVLPPARGTLPHPGASQVPSATARTSSRPPPGKGSTLPPPPGFSVAPPPSTRSQPVPSARHRSFSVPPPAASSRPPLVSTRSFPPVPAPPSRSFSEPLPLPGVTGEPSSAAPVVAPRDTEATGSERNPFLSPVASLDEGGPASLLPPPPTSAPPLSSGKPLRQTGRPVALPPPPSFSATVIPFPPAVARSAVPPSFPGAFPVSDTSRGVPIAGAGPALLPPATVAPHSLQPPPLPAGASATPSTLFPFGERRPRRTGVWISAAALVVAGGVYVGRGALGRLVGVTPGDTASLVVTSAQPGVRLSIDGRDLGALPQEASGLTAGEHVVIFEGDRYAPEKTVLKLVPGERKELGPVTLKVAKGAAKFEVTVSDVSLALVAADERRALTDYSHIVDVDNSKPWMLEASRPGFKTVRLPVTFDRTPERTFTIAFNERDPLATGAMPAAPPAPVSAVAADDSTPAAADSVAERQDAAAPARRGKRVRVAPAGTSAPAPRVAASGTCALNINSIPASKIALDGRPLGMTPKVNIAVAPGIHTVTFATDGARKTSSTSCAAGEHKTVALRL